MRSSIALVVVMALVAGCSVTRGSGEVSTQRREVSGFDRVELEGSGRVIIETGLAFALELEADDNVIDLLTYEVDGRTLRLQIEPGHTIVFASEPIFRVSLPELTGVVVEGSGELEVVDIGGGDLDAVVEGSGDISATGRLRSLDLVIEGSGSFDGERLEVESADVTVAGSGSAHVQVTGLLEAKVDGSGEIVHSGQPDLLNVEVDGSGEVRQD